jgi:hypothetical protein
MLRRTAETMLRWERKLKEEAYQDHWESRAKLVRLMDEIKELKKENARLLKTLQGFYAGLGRKL